MRKSAFAFVWILGLAHAGTASVPGAGSFTGTRAPAMPPRPDLSAVRFGVSGGKTFDIMLHLPELTEKEREIILDGCLMNYYAAGYGKA